MKRAHYQEDTEYEWPPGPGVGGGGTASGIKGACGRPAGCEVWTRASTALIVVFIIPELT